MTRDYEAAIDEHIGAILANDPEMDYSDRRDALVEILKTAAESCMGMMEAVIVGNCLLEFAEDAIAMFEDPDVMNQFADWLKEQEKNDAEQEETQS